MSSKSAERLVFSIIWIFLLSVVGFFVYIDETTPAPTIEDEGTVIDAGCTSSRNKFGRHYDCSVTVDWLEAGKQREVIKLGVLPDDELIRWCSKAHYQKPAKCWIARK